MGYENSRLFKELKQRAEELEHEVVERRQAAEKYRMVVERASDGIAIADEYGDCLEANPRMLEMLGYQREELVGRNMQDLASQEDRKHIPRSADQIRGKIFRRELHFLHRDGSFLEVEVSMSGLEDGRIQAIVHDVAERQRLEAQLRQAQKLEAVGRLAGGVAHDFNNLLTVILGHSDLVLSAMDPHDRRRHDIEDIRDAGARAAVLTNQLLAFSRKQVLQPKVISVNSAVANLTKMLGRLINSNIELVTRCEEEPWHTKVDPGQLDQVILNLALNARDAMPLGGRLVVETAKHTIEGEQLVEHPEVPPGDYVMLAVSDNRFGDGCRDSLPPVRALLYHQSAGQGDRSRTFHGIWVDLPDPSVMIRTHQRAFTQILVTLARQAVRYSDGGSLRIGTCEASRDSQDLMAVYVKPTVRLKPKDQEWIWQVFERVRRGNPPEGSELGLYLCGKLADLIGGSVEVESEADEGSRFTLLIPKA